MRSHLGPTLLAIATAANLLRCTAQPPLTPGQRSGSPASSDDARSPDPFASIEGRDPMLNVTFDANGLPTAGTCSKDRCVRKRIEPVDGGELVTIVAATKDETFQGDECSLHEWWYVKNGRGALLTRECLEEDNATDATVKDSEIVFESPETAAPSVWRGSSKIRIATNPLRVRATSSFDHHRTEGCSAERSWNWDTLRGENTLAPFTTNPILEIDVDERFRADAWKGASFDGCSTPIGALAGTATVRAVLSTEKELYVDVTDDRFVAEGTLRDHLVLFATTKPYELFELCAKDARPAVRTIRVDLDGRSSATDVTAEVSRPGRWRIRLPKETEGLSIAYVDTDDQKTVRATVANAPPAKGVRAAANTFVVDKAHTGSCVLEKGALTLRRTAREPGDALF